jgi:hypothetical protein
MYPRQIAFALFLSGLVFVVVMRLIQKGKLDIGYSWFWFGVSLGMAGTVIGYDWLVTFSAFVGVVQTTTTVFLSALVFLLLLCIQFSLTLSKHRREIKRLTQQLAILTAEKAIPRFGNGVESAE